VLTHFVVAADVARSRDFYAGVLGGEVVREGEPTFVKLANSWVIINVGGPPTDDKPDVVLEPPRDLHVANAFMNIRVADIHSTYEQWRARGSQLPYTAHRPGCRDPLLHARPRWPSDRDRTVLVGLDPGRGAETDEAGVHVLTGRVVAPSLPSAPRVGEPDAAADLVRRLVGVSASVVGAHQPQSLIGSRSRRRSLSTVHRRP
jgi:hypothetical protein